MTEGEVSNVEHHAICHDDGDDDGHYGHDFECYFDCVVLVSFAAPTSSYTRTRHLSQLMQLKNNHHYYGTTSSIGRGRSRRIIIVHKIVFLVMIFS